MKNIKMQQLLAKYLLEEGEFSSDNYPQTIEIISPITDSLNYVIQDPRIVLISEKAQDIILGTRRYLKALNGKINNFGMIELDESRDAYLGNIVNRDRIIRDYIKDYPFLDKNAAIIGQFDYTLSGVEQLFTLLSNRSQDYYIAFGLDRNNPNFLHKSMVEHYLEVIEDETKGSYKVSHDTYKDNELYLLKKDPKVKIRTKTF